MQEVLFESLMAAILHLSALPRSRLHYTHTRNERKRESREVGGGGEGRRE